MDADLKALEDKIGQFVDLAQRLRADNRNLRQQLAQAINENKRLGEKLGSAKLRLETLLARLPEEQ